MADCPIADDCPSFTERIEGMGCQYYGDRGGKEWCNHYKQPIEELKTAPVVPGEEVVVDITDLHESGSGIGHTEDGFVVMVDGLLPEARARVKVTTVKPNYARGEVAERLPMEDEADGDEDATEGDTDTESADGDDEDETTDTDSGPERPPELGSRDNFWGG